MPGHITISLPSVSLRIRIRRKPWLAEAGYADGFDMKLVISTGNQDYEDCDSGAGRAGQDRRKLQDEKMERAQYWKLPEATTLIWHIPAILLCKRTGYFRKLPVFSTGRVQLRLPPRAMRWTDLG